MFDFLFRCNRTPSTAIFGNYEKIKCRMRRNHVQSYHQAKNLTWEEVAPGYYVNLSVR
jgi:hypothetical protein